MKEKLILILLFPILLILSSSSISYGYDTDSILSYTLKGRWDDVISQSNKYPHVFNNIPIFLLKALALTAKGYPLTAKSVLNKMNHTDIQQAIQWSENFKNEHQENINPLFLLFIAYAREIEKAGIYAKKAIELDKDSPLANSFMGNYYVSKLGMKSGELDYYREAKIFFDKALTSDKKFVLALLSRAGLYTLSGEIDKAIDDARMAQKVDPDNYEAFWASGNAHTKKKEFDKAFSEIQRVIQLNSDFDWGYTSLGLIYLAQGEIDKALKQELVALEKNHKNSLANFLVGGIFFAEGQHDKAKQYLESAIEFDDTGGAISRKAEELMRSIR